MVHLKEEVENGQPFPRLILVNMGTADKANAFFEKNWPDAFCIQDPQQILYKAFEINNGSLLQFLKPGIWKAFWKSRRFGLGMPQGNTMRSPGAFLIHNESIVHSQVFKHFGEMIDLKTFRKAFLELDRPVGPNVAL